MRFKYIISLNHATVFIMNSKLFVAQFSNTHILGVKTCLEAKELLSAVKSWRSTSLMSGNLEMAYSYSKFKP